MRFELKTGCRQISTIATAPSVRLIYIVSCPARRTRPVNGRRPSYATSSHCPRAGCLWTKGIEHDLVIKWKKKFRVTGPLWGESAGHRPKASDAELWCFLWSALEQTVRQTVKTPVICPRTLSVSLLGKYTLLFQTSHLTMTASPPASIPDSSLPSLCSDFTCKFMNVYHSW